jgi:hypothetical protein
MILMNYLYSVAERLSESLHILDHDPSMALYRLQEHINKTAPKLVARKYQMAQLNTQLQGACFDLDNAIQTVEQMKRAQPTFERIQQKLKNSMYYSQQIQYEASRKGGNKDGTGTAAAENVTTTAPGKE